MTYNHHLKSRLVSLFISIFIGLASGTPYLYGIYSVQLVQKVGLTASDAASISLATNVGAGFGGLIGGVVIDHLGPQFSGFSGSLSIFVGYFGLYLIYCKSIGNLLLICVAACIMGYGSVNTYYSALKVAQANFPHNKGAASSLPVSCYGLSATVFSAITTQFFPNNTGGLLRFLAICCGLTTFIGSFSLKIFNDDDEHDDELDDNNDNILETTGLLETSDSSFSATSESDDDAISFTGSLSFWGIGKRSPRGSSSSSIISDFIPSPKAQVSPLMSRNNSYSGNATVGINRKSSFGNIERNSSFTNLISGTTNSNSVPVTKELNSKVNLSINNNNYSNNDIMNENKQIKVKIKRKKTPWEIIKKLLTSKEFLIHYLLVALISGTAQTYIYSIGFIVTAQTNYKGRISINPTAEEVQALQVSIISIGSFAGRLSAGVVSDLIHKKLKIQRSWIMVLTITVLSIGHCITMFNSGNIGYIALSSAFIGSSYGLTFGVYPAIMADNFGTRTFSTTWGLICTGPLIILYSMEKYFGILYDKNADRETGICYKGSKCYRSAFEICFGLCFIMLLINFLLIYVQHKRQKS